MSTYYSTPERIAFSDLFDGRLEQHGIHEVSDSKDISDTDRCLTDGRNYLWAFRNDDGDLKILVVYGANAPQRILEAISIAFDTDIFSEDDPQFWGFETHEEWDEALAKLAQEGEDKYYASLIKYLRGEPNDIRLGSIGMTMAKIAKELVAEDDGLMSPDRRQELMDKIDRVYEADHAVTIPFSDEDIALAELLATAEDDLPQA